MKHFKTPVELFLPGFCFLDERYTIYDLRGDRRKNAACGGTWNRIVAYDFKDVSLCFIKAGHNPEIINGVKVKRS